MAELALQFVLAPTLVGLATLVARWAGERAGGLVSAFPAIVGPVLLLTALEHGAPAAARAACGTLLGIVALSGFVLAYGRTALRAGWRMSLAAGWVTAAGLTAGLGLAGPGLADPAAGLAAAAIGLMVAFRALPRTAPGSRSVAAPRFDLPVRMGLTAALVVGLAAAVEWLGPLLGGMLAALPVLASILAVFTHRRLGTGALLELLRGMLSGMTGFVLFCAVIAGLVERVGVATGFALATLTAVTAVTAQLMAAGSRQAARERAGAAAAPVDAGGAADARTGTTGAAAA